VTRSRFTTVLGAVAILATAACQPEGAAPEGQGLSGKEALEPRAVRLVQVEAREEQPTLELVGEIRAVDTVTLAAELAGRVDRVLVEVGDRVTIGQPLLEIDRKGYTLLLAQVEAQLAAADAEAVLAGKELDRKADLLSDNTIAQAVYDQALARRDLALAQVEAARATRDLARRDLDRSVLRAPSAGAIANRMAAVGEWADVGTPLLELAAGSEVKVAARVPSDWASSLTGLEGFEFTAGRGDWREAKLYSVDPVVAGSSRSFEVVGVASNADGALRPGMFTRVRLSSPTAVCTLWLPATAVAASDMPEVMFVENHKVVVHNVQTGRRDEGMIEIVSGLGEGDEVIEKTAGLTRGIPVTVGE